MQILQAGAKEELHAPVGEDADVTCTEHNHPQDLASNKAIEEAGVLHKEGTIQS